MIHLRKFKLLIALVVIVAATVGIVVWLQHTTNAVRAEVRERFYEQYNRQQYLMAELASQTIEETFATFHRNLDLVVSLFEGQEVNRQRAEEVRGDLQKIYGTLADTPVTELVIFDRAGTVVTMEPVDPDTVGRSFAWRNYYRWAREKGKPGQMYLSPFMRMEGGKLRGSKALMLAEGIYGPQGEFRGVATVLVNFDELVRTQVLSIRMGKSGYAWLVDTSNRDVLVDPRWKVTGKSFEEAFLPRWPRLYNLLISMEDGEPGSGWYDYEDPENPDQTIRKLVSYHPVHIADRLWTLAVATPEREVDSILGEFLQRQESFTSTLLVSTLLGALAVFCVLFIWNRTLKIQVNRRTRDLSQARTRLEATFDELLAAKKAAAVGQLALGLAHEIRNPLSAIQMNMQMIRKKIASAGTLRESFVIAEGEIQRLNRLITDVMDFAHPRPLRLEPTDLQALSNRLVRLLSQRLESEGILVEIDMDSPMMLVCDSEQIHQVLLNLLLNAAEAMKDVEGEKRIVIAAAREGNSATIRVSDTGVGIPPKKRDQLFDPFFTSKAAGGGLGLTTLQAIIIRHGGSVAVESEPGEGTTFTLSLPLKGPSEARNQSE